MLKKKGSCACRPVVRLRTLATARLASSSAAAALPPPTPLMEMPADATPLEVYKKYLELAEVFHPDALANDASPEALSAAKARFVALNQEYRMRVEECASKAELEDRMRQAASVTPLLPPTPDDDGGYDDYDMPLNPDSLRSEEENMNALGRIVGLKLATIFVPIGGLLTWASFFR